MAFDEESPTDVPEIRKSDRSNSVFDLPDANLDNSFKKVVKSTKNSLKHSKSYAIGSNDRSLNVLGKSMANKLT